MPSWAGRRLLRMQDVILEVEGVSKSFPGVKALDQVSFNLRKGEVHALVGENGAGKSTLMKILSGVHQPDDGAIRYKGREVRFHDSTQARDAGIGIIYQELNLIPHLSVAANIFIGREPLTRFGTLDEKKMNGDAVAILERLNLRIDPTITLNRLPISKQQMVEIAKSLSFDSEVLIMDEPTSALTESEIDELFTVIHTLRDRGVAIIYISHRLEELKHIVDRISIFRDGRSVSTDEYAAITMEEIVSRMVGRKLENMFPARHNVPTTEKILEVRGIRRTGRPPRHLLRPVPRGDPRFRGLDGRGQVRAGAGDLRRGPHRFRGSDHERQEALPSLSVGIHQGGDRLPLGEPQAGRPCGEDAAGGERHHGQRRRRVPPPGRDLPARELKACQHYVEELTIRTPSLMQVVNNLSGGNQQKVVVAKWLFCDSKILIFDEPTRGIDVGTKYRHLRADRAAGPGGRGGHHDLLGAPRDHGNDRPRPRAARRQPRSHARDEGYDARGNPELRGGPGSAEKARTRS